MAVLSGLEELTLDLEAGAAQLATVRAFVGETWRSLGFDDEAADDARLAASEALAELVARRGDGRATVTIGVEPRTVTTRIQVVPASETSARDDVAEGERRRSLIRALMPEVREDLAGRSPSITFVVPRAG